LEFDDDDALILQKLQVVREKKDIALQESHIQLHQEAYALQTLVDELRSICIADFG